jgi:Holliday junction resolvase
MGAMQRRKGAAGEREIVRICKEHGLKATRTASLQAAPGHEAADVALDLGGFHLEVRRRERLSIIQWCADTEAAARPGEMPVVVFRPSRQPWRAALLLDDLLDLIAEARQ